MGSSSSVIKTWGAKKKEERQSPQDDAMSFRGKCGALKTIIHTDGSKIAFMKYLKDKQSEGYLDYYFEVEELKLCSGELFVKQSELLRQRYHPDRVNTSSRKRNDVGLDIWQNIEGTFSDGEIGEDQATEVMKQLKISQSYAVSVLSSYLDDFLKSKYYLDWEQRQLLNEKENIEKKSSTKAPSPVSPVIRSNSRIGSMKYHAEEPSPIAMDPVNHPIDTMPARYNRIILAEDSLVTAKITAMMLQKLGHVVDKATHGRDALALLLNPEKTYDIALIDLYMPILDGFETVRTFREQHRQGTLATKEQQDLAVAAALSSTKITNPTAEVAKCPIPNADVLIIGMSADNNSYTRNLALDAGVDYFLQKPFTAQKLSEILRDATFVTTQSRKAETSVLNELAQIS